MSDTVTDRQTDSAASDGASPLTDTIHQPVHRILHHLGGSGGTLVSRCIGCMDRIALLSETHWAGFHLKTAFNPLVQARKWWGLISEAEEKNLGYPPRIGYRAMLELIRRRALASGRAMVIREWSHMDFLGVPLVPDPPMRSTTAEVLGTIGPVHRIAQVRHPLSQWLTYRKMNGQLLLNVDLDVFLDAYLAFARMASQVGFFRYEDFTRQPHATMGRICEALAIPFDPGYAQRWNTYDKITGDVKPDRNPTRQAHKQSIAPLPPRPASKATCRRFADDPKVAEAMELLGYASLDER